jgi:two-component system chemotaxis response regulator CheB
VRTAAEGDRPAAGTIYFAPGGRHLVARGHGGDVRLAFDDGPPRQGSKPAVDALFESVAQAYGERALGVVCTGMGRDGTEGCRLLAAGGAAVIVQDEASSFVWGMPGSVWRAGLAWEAVPAEGLAASIERHVAGTALPAPAPPGRAR